MIRAIRTLIMLATATWACTAFAAAPSGSACHRDNVGGQLGWHFYCDEKEEDQQVEATHQTPSPAEQLAEFQQRLENARAAAVMNPTVANIIEYRTLHQESLEMASTFADQWQRVTWQNPEFDYTLRRPVSTVGKAAWSETRQVAQREAVANLGERYGIFFFYLSTCPYCHRYSPILKAFADTYGVHVQAVSLDGGALPDWPDAIVDQGQWASWGMQGNPVPATILFDKQTNRVVPVGFGLMARDELTSRIFMLTAREVGDDF